eukprot:CAMPEP_0171061580 /NCGR_PEP_ID=MMETSP0766_2-20121228/4533_1 /TAXON_ID=439317 /ORGANISM="Gambierdiscus australes, Strain CAWD 149" /LENGTH=43 /DNA_ID= /DNA_START= /DNA_END= /DNA_ORIENTATION=
MLGASCLHLCSTSLPSCHHGGDAQGVDGAWPDSNLKASILECA